MWDHELHSGLGPRDKETSFPYTPPFAPQEPEECLGSGGGGLGAEGERDPSKKGQGHNDFHGALSLLRAGNELSFRPSQSYTCHPSTTPYMFISGTKK